MDSNGKKVRFLREAVRAPAPANASAEARVETLKASTTASPRAFARLAEMLAWGGHLLAWGRWLALKGALSDDELAELPAPRLPKPLMPRVPFWMPSAIWSCCVGPWRVVT